MAFVRATSLAALLMLGTSLASAQTLEIATDQSPVGLDPHVATAFNSILINSNIYEGLTEIDADLQAVPALAESWTISDDGLTYTFDLRDGATFHNGDAFDSEDVVASFKRLLDTATGSPYASRFALITEFTANGPDEFVIRLSAPSAPLLSQLSVLEIIPAGYVEGGGDLQRTTMGTGPFTLAEWVPDTYLLLNAHEGYWEEGLPKLDAVKFNIVPEASTIQIGISTGTYDFAPNLQPAVAVALESDPNVEVLETLDLAYSLIGMNVSQPPFDDPRVRQALNYAIDRQSLVEAAYFGKGVPGGPLSPALADWAVPVEEFPCYAHDPERAKALLAEAGHGAGLAVTINVLGSNQVVVDSAQVVQAMLNEAGFQVELNVQEAGQFVQDWRNSNFQAFASLNGGQPDPDDYFYRTFRTDGSTNVFKYSNPELDAQLDEARTLLDKAARQAIYNEVQQTLACEGPIAHLAYGQLFTAQRPTVDGYEMIANRQTRYLRQVELAE